MHARKLFQLYLKYDRFTYKSESNLKFFFPGIIEYIPLVLNTNKYKSRKFQSQIGYLYAINISMD